MRQNAQSVIRWTLLSLYCLVILSLIVIGIVENDSTGVEYWIALSLIALCQWIFLFAAGTVNLCRPIERHRLIWPVLIASLMMAVLAGSLWLAMSELFEVDNDNWVTVAFWRIAILNWIIWFVVLFLYTRNVERFRAIRRLIAVVLGGSLLELLASIPAHIIVSRRPGCFVGMRTAIGIIAGICVMFWAFGPGIFLLFLRNRYRKNKKSKW
jgi:hypothetical protein